MELCFGIKVIGEAFALEPAEQAPLGGSDVAGGPTLDRVSDLLVGVDVVDRLGTVERQRRIRRRPPGRVLRIGVALQFLACVDGRRRWKGVGVDVVAAAAEVVVGVPGDVRGEHGHRGLRRGRSDDPREGERAAGASAGVEVVQTGRRRRLDELPVVRTAVADLVPGHAGLRVIAVGSDLHDGARAVFIVPAQAPHPLLAPAVAPQLQPIRFDRVDAELGPFAGADALGPGVAEQAVGEQAEVIRLSRPRRQTQALAAEAGLGERHLVLAGRQLGVHGPAGARARLPRLAVAGKFQQHVGQGRITLVADVADQHPSPLRHPTEWMVVEVYCWVGAAIRQEKRTPVLLRRTGVPHVPGEPRVMCGYTHAASRRRALPAAPRSIAFLRRLRATCRRRLMVPTGASKSRLICCSERPRR